MGGMLLLALIALVSAKNAWRAAPQAQPDADAEPKLPVAHW